ncbi:hypothetical protein NKR23_g3987 [Pleurostoma richardsiae]|uniref:Ubiquitin-like modifier HUB1 n=1 Tax=Pleurostoma richardsiae TaxID=41990 RepID=A0AA38VSP7_9PEZI|nr:hypothetical protein NKR23_g3987 [Pleurostoma richardsiae]
MSDQRRSSQSPVRDRSRPRDRHKSKGGIKWKNQRPAREEDDARRAGRVGGYRNRSPLRDRPRDEDRGPHRDQGRDAERKTDWDRNHGRDGRRREKEAGRDVPVDASSSVGSRPKRDKEGKKVVPAVTAAAGGEEMIIVNVNDRMGSKAAIPCFASDTVGVFKIMVASRIGRKPHEIMLRRQGERPFKDHITLGDYGISNGIQLDLEVDTGD